MSFCKGRLISEDSPAISLWRYPMTVKAIIFDLDGTLLNTLSDIGNSMNRVLRSHGLPEHPLKAYNYFVGEGAGRLVERALPEEMRIHKDKFLDCFENDYEKNWMKDTKPYPGIPELLSNWQKDLCLCILSNKPHTFTVACVNHFFPEIHFAIVLGQQPGKPRKPDPFGVHRIFKETGYSDKEVFFIGDTKVDMQTAVKTGIPAVGVTWGFRPQSELESHGANFLAHTTEELNDIIRSQQRSPLRNKAANSP
jgi:phosphoglycolate phosphatase